MTRDRIPSGPILQRAYGVLDKFKISRTFFVKTDQTDCETAAPAEEAEETENNGNYDIVVDDEVVQQELYGQDDLEGANGYYKQNVVVTSDKGADAAEKSNSDNKPEVREQSVASTSTAPVESASSKSEEEKKKEESNE